MIAELQRTYYPLTHSERRIWYQESLNHGTSMWVVPKITFFKEDVDLDLLEKSINLVIEKNDGLRLRFVHLEGKIHQYVNEFEETKLDLMDFSGKYGDNDFREWMHTQSRTPFRFLDNNLFYFALVKLKDRCGFFLKVHHIICDGWSLALITRQVVDYYNKLKDDEFVSHEENPSYLQYIESEKQYLESEKLAVDKAYWNQVFDTIPEPVELASRIPSDRLDSERVAVEFPLELSQKIYEFTRMHDTSVFKLFMAALYAYISRATRSEDFVIGSGFHGRLESGMRDMVGMFVSTIPLRINSTQETSFSALLDKLRSQLKSMLWHQKYPYDMLINDLQERDPALKNLFNVGLVQFLEDLYPDEVETQFQCNGNLENNLTIYLNYNYQENEDSRIKLMMDYRVELFTAEEIKALGERLMTIVGEVLENPSVKIKDLHLLPEEEREKLLHKFNDTAVDYPTDKIFIQYFQDKVREEPYNTAVVYKDQKLTYGQLNEKSNQLAGLLRSKGVKPEDIVGILMDRSTDMVTGILGVLKSGAAYMPIDPDYPMERIRYMLEDSGAKILISHPSLYETLDFSGEIIDLEEDSIFTGDDNNPELINKPSDLAYIIYTSGSTGKPKGVMIEHHSLVNLCFWYSEYHMLTPDDNVTKYAGFGFDASVWEIFPALFAGSAIHVIADDIRLSPLRVNEYFEANNITVSFLPTQFAEQFMDLTDNRSLRWLDVAGDKLRIYKPRNYKVVNDYGPTENTVATSSFEVEREYYNIPIGKPISNVRVYILDKDNRLQPIGAAGELCVSGIQLARGYLNMPEKTKEKFVENPFEPGQLMYRTGDLARWRFDGNLEFLGRIDNQVKIRGFRIELGEIEQLLLKQDTVRNAVVIDRSDSHGNKYLCGYFVPEEGADVGDIKKALSVDLPDYMIPSYLIKLDRIPLTANGKVDRKALPMPRGTGETGVEYVAPRNYIERRLEKIWRDVLDLERIGVNDDFFSLGGHSLRAAAIQAKVEKEFNVIIPLKEIFKYTTISQMADYINEADKNKTPPLKPVEERDHYPVTSAQKRLFVMQQMEGIGVTYNVPVIMKIQGDLDPNRLGEALQKLVDRQDSLRTSFEIIDGEPVQVVHKKVKLRRKFREADENQVEDIIRDFVRPFDLTMAPLLRLELIKTDQKKFYLLMDFHHIIFDGVSVSLLFDELSQLYNGEESPVPKIHYRDYAVWRDIFIKSDAIKPQEDFWLKEFSGDIPIMDLPTDRRRPTVQDFAGGLVNFSVERLLTEKLKDLASNTGVTLHMILTAAINVLMAKYTSQEEIIIGTPSAGRRRDELRNLIGMFVETLPVRSFPADGKTFKELLLETRENLLGIYENQDYPIEKLIDKLNVSREPGRNPLFDVVFVFQNIEKARFSMEGLQVDFNPLYNNMAKFDLLFTGTEKDGRIDFDIEYRTAVYNRETPVRMASHLINILREISENPDIYLKDVDILTREERKRLLYGFNLTDAEYPRNKTIHAIFEEQAEKFPGNIALKFEDKSLTYRELNEKANQLARVLREKGVKNDTLVAVLIHRSLEMVVSLLAVLKAGGAYIPINPDYPMDRTRYMLEDSGTKIMLTDRELAQIVGFQGEVIDITDENTYRGESANLEHINDPMDLAYIIYTSGSTGKPKGVMIDHHNVVRLLHNDHFQYSFSEKDIWTMFHSFCFDFSVWEMYGALLYGGTLIVVPISAAHSPVEFVKLLAQEKVTVLNQTPGAFYNLIAEEAKLPHKSLNLRYVTFGGEALMPVLLKPFHERYPDTKLINMYGITETCVHVTFKEIGTREIENNISNIGLPIPTLTSYVMDRNLALVPIGVAGEMTVGGDGVARGYLNRPDLTAQKFVGNPYRPQERIYRSGDLVKRLPSGDLEYLGRIDFQVKVRGFRVELGEIENKLLKNKSIHKVMVLARDDKQGAKYLCAYYTGDREIPVTELREFLEVDLPDYMIPSYFIRLGEFPLTPNGKVDRRALPEPGKFVSTGETYVAPRNDKETKMAGIWREVLGVERVGIHDNFFALGGHSLKAVTLVARLQKFFEVGVNDIFEHQTISELAENVVEREDNLEARLDDLKKMAGSMENRTEEMMKDPAVKAAMESYKKENEKIVSQDISPVREYKHILLTGTTGFLGSQLLHDLLTEGDCKVSVIIRGDTADKTLSRLQEKMQYYFGPDFYEQYRDRVKVINGNLTRDKFGLSDEAYSRLAGEVDCVINSAANVKHYGKYEEFHPVNVEAVQRLLDFCREGLKKDFNQVSTISVAMTEEKTGGLAVFTEDNINVGQVVSNYYVKTKLEAEEAIQAARESGLRANIFRIGNIVFHSGTGLYQENIEDNAFYSQVKAFVNLGAVPEIEDEVDFSFVDYVSKSILCLYNRENLESRNYHIVNPRTGKLSEILTAKELNLNVEKMPFGSFIDYLLRNFEMPGFRRHIENVMLHRGWLSESGEIQESAYLTLCDRTNLILEKLGFQWMQVEPEKLNRMISRSLKDRMDFLKDVPIFRQLTEAPLDELARLARMEACPDETDLLWEGEVSRNFYVLMDGSVELNRQSRAGWLGTICILGPGDYVGEANLWEEAPSPVTAEAVLGDTSVLSFRAEDILGLLVKYPAFATGFLREMSDRVKKLESIVVEMA